MFAFVIVWAAVIGVVSSYYVVRLGREVREVHFE